VFSNIFDEYNFDSSSLPASQISQDDDAEASPTPLVFEIPLNTLLDCLNIFGTASASATTSSKLRRWKEDAGETEREDGPVTSIGTTGTGMRLVYGRVGEPLTLIM
jgi:cell cycle checkpoint protein